MVCTCIASTLAICRIRWHSVFAGLLQLGNNKSEEKERPMSKSAGVLLTLLMVCGSALQAKVVYVNKNAPGPTYDGTSWATAFTTVQAGINAAVSGDEVWVAKSAPTATAYVENLTIWQYDVSMYGGFEGTENVRSQRDTNAYESALVAAKADSSVVRALSRLCTIDGFSIKNGINGVEIQGTVTVSNCEVSENTFGIAVVQGTGSTSRCIISGNGFGLWVGIFATNTLEVSNSIINENRYGVHAQEGTATVSNCTISGNSSSGVYVDYKGTALVSNSIVGFNGIGIGRDSASYTLTLLYNDVYGNTTSNYDGIPDATGTNGNISADPLFVDRAAGNFHLLPGSPCIDAGDDAVVTAGQTDLAGQPRIQGAHVDMGSYETSGVTGYRWWDAARALSIAGGAIQATAADIAFLNTDSSDGVITVRDAARIARKAAGLDANP